MTMVNMTPHQVQELLAKHAVVLVDVREPQEYMAERIEGALLFPLSTFDPAMLPAVVEGRPIVFHCGAGKRSAMAVEACQKAGIAHLHHMAGGMGAWKMAGLPYLQLDPRSGRVCSVCS